MKKQTRPGIWFGHVFRKVRDVGKSTAFYRQLELRHIMSDASMAIFELRGGTHLLLFKDSPRANWVREQDFDFMVKDLKKFHAKLKRSELRVSALKKDRYHLTFTVTDPDKKKIVIYSDHTDGRNV